MGTLKYNLSPGSQSKIVGKAVEITKFVRIYVPLFDLDLPVALLMKPLVKYRFKKKTIDLDVHCVAVYILHE